MSEQDPITTALREIADQAAQPWLRTDATWRAGRRRRWTAITTSVAGAAAAAVLVPLAALSGPAHLSRGPASLGASSTRRPPVEFRQVATIVRHACPPHSAGLPGATKNECFYLTHTGMTITRFASIKITQPPGQTTRPDYILSFRLQRPDIRPYADLTRKLTGLPSPRDQLAIIAHGVVVVHPSVLAPLDSGIFEITAGHTRAQAQQLLQMLDHR